MAKKKKQDIGEAVRRFRQAGQPQMPKPKPPELRPPDYYDSPGFQSPERRKASEYMAPAPAKKKKK